MTSYLPPKTLGYLPYWHLLTGSLALLNALRAHRDPSSVALIFDGPCSHVERSSLAVRNYGAWTATAGLVRLLAAYRVSDPGVTTLAAATYAIVLLDFGAEWKAYGTMRLEKRMAAGLATAGWSLVWMWMGWSKGWYF